jgi:hypothetical protein
MRFRRTLLTPLLALLLAAPTALAASPGADAGPCALRSVLQDECSFGQLLSAAIQAVWERQAMRGSSKSDPDAGSTELRPGMDPNGGTTELGPGMDPNGGTAELRPDMDPDG